MDRKLVKRTWIRCLKNEEELPEDWPSRRGVLVGILTTHPQDATGGRQPSRVKESHTVP